MKLKKIAIKNYKGISDVEFSPSAVTIISGANGEGKTSIIDAIRAFDERIHNPARIRTGAEVAEVRIDMDNGHVYRMRVTQKATTWDLMDEKGRKITRSAEHIRSIINSISLDPLKFLSQKPEEQINTYLRLSPLRLTASDLGFMPLAYLKGVDLDKHALEVIGDERRGLYGALYQERTAINRIAKEKWATAKQMADALPAEPEEGGWNDAFEMAKTELAKLNVATQKAIAEIKDANAAHKAEIEATLQKEIDELRAIADSDKVVIDRQRDIELSDLQADYTPKRDALNARLTQAKTILEQQAKTEKTREFIAQQQAEAKAKAVESERLSESLVGLEALKFRLKSESPIPGLEIGEGGLVLNGVAFAEVNDAERLRIAFEIAKLQPGEFRLIMIDYLEHLDKQNRAAFEEAAKASGLQVIAAEVRAEGELEVSHVA